jgi:uncharacterized protein (TIGR02466 family)
MNRELVFPTPIYAKQFSKFKALNKKLTKDIIEWSKNTPTLEKTNSGEGWHSPTIMHTLPEYKDLLNEIMIFAQEVFKDWFCLPPANMGNMWCNINYPGAFNIEHIHPNATLSCAYYIKVPKDSGTFYVIDPRPGPNILMPRRPKHHVPRPLWRVIKYPPMEGTCLMFPGWLPHGVEYNKSKEKGQKSWRISVSANIYQGNAE